MSAEKMEGPDMLKQRKEFHQPITDVRVALSRIRTLGRRLRYAGDTYNADIVEFELMPFLVKETEIDALGRKINGEKSGPEFAPFFLHIDRQDARRQLSMKPRHIKKRAKARAKWQAKVKAAQASSLATVNLGGAKVSNDA